ncbi:hypothetical protein DFH06DRAFT_1477492 [Mycena polygramma]|nr:hypothetical protein DFH06DRAFT_1477492 [Mycena polygramma]
MSQSATKRKRTEDAPTISRSDIWYQDGSVVLQAEGTQFRVHWGVLANSSFFRDMQALPQPPEQPTVEGCPIVELHDLYEDVNHLLTVLYDPTILFQKVLPLAVVAALLRLGRKYDFRKILDAAVQLVMYDNPTTLEDYLKHTTMHVTNCNALEMLTLVRENNIMSAQPCAYYEVVRGCEQSQLFDGVPRDDGTLAFLAPNDLRQCNLSRERIIAKQMLPGFMWGWLVSWDYREDCALPRICAANREHMLQISVELHQPQALDIGGELWDRMFCPECLRHMEKRIDAGRKKMWEELPSFFDLPPWSELKNDL